MPYEANTLFPGLLSESAMRVAQDTANHPGSVLPASLIHEMGWNAVLIPEEQGGAGGDFQDLAAIIEGLATHAVNLPVTARCGIVPAILNALPNQPDVHAIQRAVADGSMVIELGGPMCPSDPTPPLSFLRDENGWRLSGATSGVELTADCTHILVVGQYASSAESGASHERHAHTINDSRAIPQGITQKPRILGLIPSMMLEGKSVRFQTMDDRQIVVLDVDGLVLGDEHILAIDETANQAILAGWRIAAAANATDAVCSMSSALSRTIGYLQERKQFGHPLADFQALRHDVARLYVTYELARSLLQATLRTLDPPSQTADDTSALDLMGLYIGREAIRFAERIIQLHGGMGMTREMPAAQLATRLLTNALRFGDPLSYYKKIDNLRK